MAQVAHAISAGRTQGGSRLDAVDLLRGLAILFVLLNHVHMRLFLAKIPYTKGLPSQLVSSLVWNGQYGVQIFFAVSGFLITSTSIRRWRSLSALSLKDFYAFRFARIAPLLLLLLVVLSAFHLAGLKNFIVPDATGGLGRALVAALTFHINVLEASRGYLPGSWDILWSLSVEEMFYLFFPLVCLLLGREKWLTGFMIVFVLLGPFGRTVLTYGNEVWKEYSYLGAMDAIALGCLTALISSKIAIPAKATGLITALGIVILVFILGFSNAAKGLGLAASGFDMTILAIGTCLLIAAAAQSGWQSPRLFAPLIALGRRSYEVYLTHMFVVFALFGLFKSTGASPGAIPILFIGVILLSALVGALVARFYSDPMNRATRERLVARTSYS